MDISGKQAQVSLAAALLKVGPVDTKLFQFFHFYPSTLVFSLLFFFSTLNYQITIHLTLLEAYLWPNMYLLERQMILPWKKKYRCHLLKITVFICRFYLSVLKQEVCPLKVFEICKIIICVNINVQAWSNPSPVLF